MVNMEDQTQLRPISNGRTKRTSDWWEKQKDRTGRRTSGRISKPSTVSSAPEPSKVELQIRQGDKPTVLHIVKTKLPPGAKRVNNNNVTDATKEHYVSPSKKSVSNNNYNHTKSHLQVLIKNLSLDVTKEQLQEHFRKTGGIKSIQIPKEKGQNIGKGIAYMDFKTRISHGIALRLHQTTLGGKPISVEFCQNSKKSK